MKPVFQTKTGKYGNCMSACLASVLELPIEMVPNFYEVIGDKDDAAQWWAAVTGFLKPFNLGITTLHFQNPDDFTRLPGIFIVVGTSPRGLCHATVWKDGALIHDPHPGGGGVQIETVDFLYPLDPSRPPTVVTPSNGSHEDTRTAGESDR